MYVCMIHGMCKGLTNVGQLFKLTSCHVSTAIGLGVLGLHGLASLLEGKKLT